MGQALNEQGAVPMSKHDIIRRREEAMMLHADAGPSLIDWFFDGGIQELMSVWAMIEAR